TRASASARCLSARRWWRSFWPTITCVIAARPAGARPVAPGRSTGLEAFPPYSYRDDPSIPRFPDDTPLIVFDGVCVLCGRVARFVANRGTARRFGVAQAQSDLGRALFRPYGFDDVDYETHLLI